MREPRREERVGQAVFTLQNAADIPPEPINWIWHGMLARGTVHVLAGRGGMGKTTLMLKVAATITSGNDFPDCQISTDAENVIYISAEDRASNTLVPRFLASGGEQERFYVMEQKLSTDGQYLSILDHYAWLTDVVQEKSAALLILDPVTAFCGTTLDNNSPTHVRSVLARLQQVADSTHVAVMCLNHLTKRRDGAHVDQVLGSGAWSHAPRIVWGVIANDGKYLGLLKSNISGLEHVYPFSLSPIAVEGVEAYCARIGGRVKGAHLSNYVDVDDPQRGQKIVDAREFLRDRLRHGSAPKQKLIQELEALGVSESTIQRAARELGIISDREKTTHGPALWSLPDAVDER